MEANAYVNFLTPYIGALQTEITTIKESGGSHKRLIDGRLLDNNNNRYVYSFEADDELHLPDDSPVMITVGKQSVKGFIIACEGFTVVVSLADDLGKFMDSAELVSESWMILERLCDHLKEDRIQNASLPRALEQGRICRMLPFVCGQDEAIKRSISQPITIIWGPPGTGKTYTLAKIAIEHIRLGHRILMASHSNVSVDEAIYKTASLSNYEPGVLIRYGYPRNENVASSYLSSMNLALSTKPELFSKRKCLLTEKRKLKECGIKDTRYVDIERKLKDIRTQIREEERRLVLSAKMVATTISKAVMDSAIYDSKYDVVLFDEASMAYVPQVLFAASLAKVHFCCFGDYKQLPPIVQSDHPQTKSLLSKDIFSVVGVSDAVARNSGHDWLVMLNLQHRMHSHIARFVSVHMYNGLLKTPPDFDTNLIAIIDAIPTITSSMSMIDLTGMMSVCNRTLDHSRYNLLSAFISVKVALASRQTPNPHVPDHLCSVGIATPYSAQARLMRAMLRDMSGSAENNPEIMSSTVHQFQGSERDIIIYDATDCYRQPYPGILLTGMDNDSANRLLNVAITRAKSKFILIGNQNYLTEKISSKNLLFTKLMIQLRYIHAVQSGELILRLLNKVSDDNFKVWDNDLMTLYLCIDIKSAKQEIRIDIPHCCSTGTDSRIELITQRLIEANHRGIRVVIRAENKIAIPPELLIFTKENAYVWNPIVIIDNKIVWFGQPQSLANFNAAEGSEPILVRPNIRMVGSLTARTIRSMLNMDKIEDSAPEILEPGSMTLAAYIYAHQLCKFCGKPMLLVSSKKGTPYIRCSAKCTSQAMEYVDQDVVNAYLKDYNRRCPVDAAQLIYGRSKGRTYVYCEGSKRHFYSLCDI